MDSTDFETIGGKIAIRIAKLRSEIEERTERIRLLTEENETAAAQITELQTTEQVIDTALVQVRKIDHLFTDDAEPTMVRVKRGPSNKKTILPILTNAGSFGLTLDEIIAQANRDGVQLKMGSARTFLSQQKTAGILAVHPDGRWHMPSAVNSVRAA